MRKMTTALAGLVVAAAAAAVVATPASAATGPLYVVKATNPEHNHEAEVVLSCGTDYLYGTGFSDTGGGLVKVDRLEPTSTSTLTVHAASKLPGPNESPLTGWTLTGYAVCGPTQNRLTNLTVEPSPTSGSGNATAGATATASCKSPQVPIGGGWRINAPGNDQGGITVTDMSAAGFDMNVTAAPQDSTNGSVPSPWTVTAFAICANASSSAGVRYLSATATPDIASQAKFLNCKSGESRTSAGFSITDATGDNVIRSLQPTVNPLGTLDQAYAAVDTVQDGHGYNKNWGLKVSAVCATI